MMNRRAAAIGSIEARLVNIFHKMINKNFALLATATVIMAKGHAGGSNRDGGDLENHASPRPPAALMT
jgi:hypothetical protein